MARLPFRYPEIARRRAERVGDVVPDVAFTVAVLVDRVVVIGCGNELRVAHGAGPRSVHALEGDVAVLEDLQRGDDLRFGELGLGPGAVERAERADDVLVAGLRAVVRLHTPDGDEDVTVDAVFGFELIEQCLVLDQLLLARLDALVRDHAVDIFADRLHVFWLVIRHLDHFGIGRETLKRAVERLARDAGSLGLRP
jgi:hypothetical protein